MTDKALPAKELDCFFELEKMGYIYRGEFFSPTRAEHGHYSKRLVAAKKGKRVAIGRLA